MNDKKCNRILGRVKWFNSRIGYGFITAVDEHHTYDYFIHWKNILYKENNNCYILLYKNELVEFELKDFGLGIQAFNVSGPKNSSIIACSLGKTSKYLNIVNKYSKTYEVHQLQIDEFKSIDNLSPKTLHLFNCDNICSI